MSINDYSQTNWGAAKRFRLVLREQGTVREMGGEEMSLAVGIVDNIFMNALDTNTSDIHLQPERDQLRIRYRQDGILHETGQLPPEQAQNVLARLKLSAGMRIDEQREPQDGRIDMEYMGRRLSARASCVPCLNGEKFVMRILDPNAMKVELPKLGMPEDVLEHWARAIQVPYGLILVTGPTGSGKTSTLYASIHQLDSKTRNIVTVEDPIEYEFEKNIAQVQVTERLTFPKVMRSFLRQDPDVMLVGEMRDPESLAIGIQAGLTGHLVLSTLHTNDAASAFTRLVDMGLEPFLVAASVRGVQAQRLVRRLCEQCAVDDDHPLLPQGWSISQPAFAAANWKKAMGCSHCHHTGYRGRLGIYELVALDGELQQLVNRQAPLQEIKSLIRQQGQRTLFEDGLIKASRGLTSIEEVMRVAYVEHD